MIWRDRGDLLACFLPFARKAAGAFGARHSPRPQGRMDLASPGRKAVAGRVCVCPSVVITGLVPVIHVFLSLGGKDVDGRVIGERKRRRSSNGYARPRRRRESRLLRQRKCAPSPLAGEGWGEGATVFRTIPLTRIAPDVRSDLSRKGRGEERVGCLTFEYENTRPAISPPPATPLRRATACRGVRGGKSRDGRSLTCRHPQA